VYREVKAGGDRDLGDAGNISWQVESLYQTGRATNMQETEARLKRERDWR
jgi:hypothetical protein